jgi:hypothetical protein
MSDEVEIEEEPQALENDPTEWAVLDEREQVAMDTVCSAYRQILDLGLTCNHGELETAVHVMQNMIAHRMLQRNGKWGNWFDLDYAPDDAKLGL